jgi:hypothetical protein
MKKLQLTDEILVKSNYKELAALCPQLGVKFKNQDRRSLLTLLRRAAGFTDKISTSKKRNADKLKKGALQKSLKKEKSTSDLIRELTDKGKSVLEITKQLGIHYSFCHGVVQRHKNSAKS